MQFSWNESLSHTYVWCSQLDSPLRLQENLCVYRCVCAYMCAYGVMVESILLMFVIDTLSVSTWKRDILWTISNLILERWREIYKLVTIWLKNMKAQVRSLSFLVAWKFESTWMWMKFMGVNLKWISVTTLWAKLFFVNHRETRP